MVCLQYLVWTPWAAITLLHQSCTTGWRCFGPFLFPKLLPLSDECFCEWLNSMVSINKSFSVVLWIGPPLIETWHNSVNLCGEDQTLKLMFRACWTHTWMQSISLKRLTSINKCKSYYVFSIICLIRFSWQTADISDHFRFMQKYRKL